MTEDLLWEDPREVLFFATVGTYGGDDLCKSFGAVQCLSKAIVADLTGVMNIMCDSNKPEIDEDALAALERLHHRYLALEDGLRRLGRMKRVEEKESQP